MSLRDETLESTTASDQYYNYCWWPYTPVAPQESKLRPVNLLLHSFNVAGLNARPVELVRLIQKAIGAFRTVWGIKWTGGRLAWEFYFYDYKRRQRDVSITRVLQAVHPLLRSPLRVNEALPYFMFSLDILPELLGTMDELRELHMYIGNPGSAVSSGIAYSVRPDATTLENFYFFFDARRDLNQAISKVRSSAYIDSDEIDIDQILRPQLRDCHTLCIANKRHNDTAYFSGVKVDQLLFFLRELAYPPAIVTFVEEHRGRLDHLLYDVGFDYVAQGEQLRIIKSGFYGVF
jgi:hypothetical protein